MPLFRYRAVDPFGEAMEGTMEEESAHQVATILRERGAQVNSVEEVGGAAPRHFGLGPKRLRWDDVAIVNSQLLAITRAGIPVSASVNALAKDIENKRLRPVLDSLHRDLEAGRSLEESLARSPEEFPPLYLSLIRAGERSGNLPGVMEMIGSYSTRILDLRDRIFMASVYPAFVLVTAFLTLSFILIKVVPTYEEVFTDFGGSLPGITRLLLSLSHAANGYGAYAFLAFVLFSVASIPVLSHLRWSDGMNARFDRLRSSLPVIGRTFRVETLARFSKSLGMLLIANVPIEESLDLATAASGNEFLRLRVRKATKQIAQGEKVAEAFLDTRYFPHSYLWFLANGERLGQLPRTLLDLSDTYEREVSTRDRAFLSLLAPALIVCLGAVIVFVAVALYLPIFSLGDAISGNS